MNDESVNHGAKSSVAKVEEMRESEQDPGVFWQVGSRSRRRPPRGPVLWRTRDTSWQVHGCVSWMIDVCVIGKQLSGEINTFLCGQNHHTEPALTLTVGIATEWKAQRSTPGRRVCASLWSRRRAEPYVFLFNFWLCCVLAEASRGSSHCDGLSGCGARALACTGFSSCTLRALKRGLSSCGTCA